MSTGKKRRRLTPAEQSRLANLTGIIPPFDLVDEYAKVFYEPFPGLVTGQTMEPEVTESPEMKVPLTPILTARVDNLTENIPPLDPQDKAALAGALSQLTTVETSTA